MSAHASLLPELEEVIRHGSSERRATTLRRITTLFLDGAGRFNDDHLGVFDLVFSRLIPSAEAKARTELAHRLAPLNPRNLPRPISSSLPGPRARRIYLP